jgi:GT2 family glycosyltransferase
VRYDATIAIATLSPDPVDFREVLERAVSADRPVLVVDMTPDDSVREACAFDDSIEYHAFKESTGLSDSRNRILDLAATKIVVFLDSDAFPHGDWVSPLVARLEEPGVAIVGARVVPRWSTRPPRLFRSGIAGFWLSAYDLGSATLEVPFIVGTSFALDRTRAPDRFDVLLGRHPGDSKGGEEIDFCLRARASGLRVAYEPRALVEHRVSAERTTWRWMLRRAFLAGYERSTLTEESVPYTYKRLDFAFMFLMSPALMAGRLAGRRT